jgi:uncharacterized BrkB/YihY/UPF0761 family membrane protein
MAAANTTQAALQDIWDIPPFERPNVALRRLRSIAFLVLLAIGISASTLAVSAPVLVDLGPLAGVAAIVITFVIDAAMLLATFKLFISDRHRIGDLVPGVLVAATAFVILQAVGSIIVRHYIAGASDTYGTFAVVIALLSWFFLVSRVVLLGAELDAVLVHRLTPRSLVGGGEVTDGDLRAVHYDARRVQRDPRIGVAVSVDGEAAVEDAEVLTHR